MVLLAKIYYNEKQRRQKICDGEKSSGDFMKKILVIEDENAINDLICINLEIAGYEPIPFLDRKSVV